MNGKKAKQIRKIAKEQVEGRGWPMVEYQQINRRVKNYQKMLKGLPTGEFGQYETFTLALGKCERKFLKELKKKVKNDGLESIILA